MFEMVTQIQQEVAIWPFQNNNKSRGVGLIRRQQIKGLTDKSLHGDGWLLGGEPPSLWSFPHCSAAAWVSVDPAIPQAPKATGFFFFFFLTFVFRRVVMPS